MLAVWTSDKRSTSTSQIYGVYRAAAQSRSVDIDIECDRCALSVYHSVTSVFSYYILRESYRRRNTYYGHPRLCVCVCVCLSVCLRYYIQLYSPLLVEKSKSIKNKQTTKEWQKINITNNLNYIHLSSSSYYIDFHRQKSEKNKQVTLANIG